MVAPSSIYFALHMWSAVVELMTETIFQACCLVLSHTCQPSDTSTFHGHGINKENIFLNMFVSVRNMKY